MARRRLPLLCAAAGLLLLTSLALGPLRADPFASPPALPPADLGTLRITATPERSRYLLGETVRVHFSVANLGPAPITVRRDNDTAFWRPTSLHVTVLDDATGEPLPAAPSGFDLFNYRYGRRHTLAPGETWTHAFFPLRFVEPPGPGRYRFQLRHTLGWPDENAAPAAPEFTLEFEAPSPGQAASLVAALPHLESPTDDAPLSIDTCGFNYPIYVPHLLARIATGEPALLDSLDRLPTPAATAALLILASNSHAEVAAGARSRLLHRLPLRAGITSYGGDAWPAFPAHGPRHDDAWTSAEIDQARALARELLRLDLPELPNHQLANSRNSPAFAGAALLAPFGEAADLKSVADCLTRVAYSRTLETADYRHHSPFIIPDEYHLLRAAFAAMHGRGIRAPLAPTSLGEAILLLDQFRLDAPPAGVAGFAEVAVRSSRTLGPRPAAWLHQLGLLDGLVAWPAGPSAPERPSYLGDAAAGREPNARLLIAALESIPAPLPPECLPFVHFAFESSNPYVVHAACAVAVETQELSLLPALQRVLASENDPWLRTTVVDAIAQLGDRVHALRSLASDLAVTSEPGEVLARLGALVFATKAPQARRNLPVPSRSARLALRDSWLTFLALHEKRLLDSAPFTPGAAEVPAELFAGFLSWRREDGSYWPWTPE